MKNHIGFYLICLLTFYTSSIKGVATRHETNLDVLEFSETPKLHHQKEDNERLTTHQLWDGLLQKNVSNYGVVDYKQFKKDYKKLRDYIEKLSLIRADNNFMARSKSEKLAYWINAYNALTIDLILRHYPVKSIKDINNPWKQRLWTLGGTPIDLDEIEHQILRKMNEPRIHFAIVCASVSCPKLQNQAYTASNIEA